MKIDDVPPYSIILFQYRDMLSAVITAAQAQTEQSKLEMLLALKGMLDGVYSVVETHAINKGRGLANMVYSEISGQGGLKMMQRLVAQSLQLLALDARPAEKESSPSSSGGRDRQRQRQFRGKSGSGGGRDMSKIQCHECGQFGHMKVKCPLLKAKTS